MAAAQATMRNPKRKRDDASSPSTPARGAPNSRRGDEASNNQFDQGGPYDLSALAAHQSGPTHAGGQPGAPNMDTAAAALSQHYTMTVPPHPAESFLNEPTRFDDGPGQGDFHGLPPTPSHGHGGDVAGSPSLDPVTPGGDGGTPLGRKPTVGSAEWQKVRKDNHKEVERRRRETINEGINELAKIVPGCEKNKGSILARAVQYIQKLQDDATSNIDKWTFEKLVTEQAIGDLSARLQRSWREKEAWRNVAREAGVDVDAVDLGIEPDDADAKADKHDAGQSAEVAAAEQIGREAAEAAADAAKA